MAQYPNNNNGKKSTTFTQMERLKGQLGSWIFAVMSSLSKDEFVHMIKNMNEDSRLQSFKTKVEQARSWYREVLELCTSKQEPHAASPFFYSIRLSVGTKYEQVIEGADSKADTQGGVLDVAENTLNFDIALLHAKRADVTKKIPTQAAFGQFCKAIAEALSPRTDTVEIVQLVSEDMNVISAALDTQQGYFKQLEEQKMAKLKKREELEKQKLLDTQADSEMKTYWQEQEQPVSTPSKQSLAEDLKQARKLTEMDDGTDSDEVDELELERENYLRKRNGNKLPPVQRKLDFGGVEGPKGKKSATALAKEEAATIATQELLLQNKHRQAALHAAEAVKRSFRHV